MWDIVIKNNKLYIRNETDNLFNITVFRRFHKEKIYEEYLTAKLIIELTEKINENLKK